MTDYREADFARLKTVPIARRSNKVDPSLLAHPPGPDRSFAAFLYWIRTVPLEIGKRYEYARYFRPDRNPVIIEVLKRERVGVAGKKWNAIVVRPRIPQGRGIFAEKSETRIWLSDDPRRIVLAIQSNFSFGQVTLKLKELSVPEQP